jgi:hypothetical protein
MDDFVDPAKDWRQGDLGQALITYAEIPAGIDSTIYDFPAEDQPFVGVLDTGFSGNNPDLDYSRIQLGKDWVDGDNNPLLADGEGNEHGTHTLGLIAAEQGNNLGIDGLNDDAPLWVGRAIGSGQWHESLREFVDAAQDSGQPNAVINLSLDLTQIDGEGNVTTRYEFTPQEREAIEYARQNGVLLVVAAGNDGGVMSVLGQAAQEFDNILTVGAADGLNRADYSSYGNGLGLLAAGGTPENPVVSLMADGLGTMAGTSVATAQVTGAVSQVWAANPALSYRQVIEILQATATDLDAPGWDAQTGAGLLNLPVALLMAKAATPQNYGTPAIASPTTWSGEGIVTPSERAANPTAGNGGVVGTVGQGFRRPYQVRPGDSLRSIAVRQLNDGGRWDQIQRANGSTFGAVGAALVPGDVVYLPVQYQQGTGTAVGTANVSVTKPQKVQGVGGSPSDSELLFYDVTTRHHAFYGVKNGRTQLRTSGDSWRGTWDIIVPGNFNGSGKSDLLFYDRDAGEYAFYAVTNDGRMNRLSSGDNWRTTWDMIIPGDFGGDGKTDLLFYDRDAGLYAFYTVSSNGKLSRLSDGDNWRKTWDMIIPGNFGGDGKTDLLFYDRDTGSYAFYAVTNNGEFDRLSGGDNWRKNWDVVGYIDNNDEMQADPSYIYYKESDYLNTLYQDNIGNRVSSRRNDGYHNTGRAIDSSACQSDRQVFALVGGEVVEAKNGVERSSNKNWKENGTVAIYNSELNKTFIYWHFDEGSIDERLKGKTVKPGDFLGKEGNTGLSDGAHTHVEVHQGRLNINMAASSAGVPANAQRLNVTQVFQEAVRKGLVKLYR